MKVTRDHPALDTLRLRQLASGIGHFYMCSGRRVGEGSTLISVADSRSN